MWQKVDRPLRRAMLKERRGFRRYFLNIEQGTARSTLVIKRVNQRGLSVISDPDYNRKKISAV
jgi:hypothetical protein